MVGFHLFIISTFPVAVPLAWNALFAYAVVFLFLGFPNSSGYAIWDMSSVWPTAVLLIAFCFFPVLGNLRPDLVSFLPANLPDIDDRTVREAEIVCNTLVGFNFGDGHLHDEDLLRAVQDEAAFELGELVVVWVESQPTFAKVQHYKVIDATLGIVERGTWKVADVGQDEALLDQPLHSALAGCAAEAVGAARHERGCSGDRSGHRNCERQRHDCSGCR